MTREFRKLKVWNDAKDIAVEVYRLTKSFPDEEKFGITQQMRRAACSITANIAEGCGRMTNKDFKRFLYNSMGSLKELENFLDISFELKYLDIKSYERLIAKTSVLGKMLFSFAKNCN